MGTRTHSPRQEWCDYEVESRPWSFPHHPQTCLYFNFYWCRLSLGHMLTALVVPRKFVSGRPASVILREPILSSGRTTYHMIPPPSCARQARNKKPCRGGHQTPSRKSCSWMERPWPPHFGQVLRTPEIRKLRSSAGFILRAISSNVRPTTTRTCVSRD